MPSLTPIVDLITSVSSLIKSQLQTVLDLLSKTIDGLTVALKTILGKVTDALQNLTSKLSSLTSNVGLLGNLLDSLLTSTVNSVQGIVNNAIDTLSGIVQKVITIIKQELNIAQDQEEALLAVLKKLVGDLTGCISVLSNDLAKEVNTVTTSAGSLIASATKPSLLGSLGAIVSILKFNFVSICISSGAN